MSVFFREMWFISIIMYVRKEFASTLQLSFPCLTSLPLPHLVGSVVKTRHRRRTCTTAPWTGRATSTGVLCSPLSTSHPNRSWSSRRRWAGHHCLHVLCSHNIKVVDVEHSSSQEHFYSLTKTEKHLLPRLTLQVWDNDLFSPDDFLGEGG